LSGIPPPGVPPAPAVVPGQFIVSQQGMPGFYHQSLMYSDEHMQMVPSRIPHHMVKLIT